MGSQSQQRSGTTPAPGRVFVVGAYLPNGGTYMAYHLGRMLQIDFGWDAIAVTVDRERKEDSVQEYDVVFPTITLDAMEEAITEHDILIANPSFSSRWFGPRLPGRKLMYIQHFNTFTLLDAYFDHYVCVSDVVSRFVSTVYGLSAPTISPFIKLERRPYAPAWRDRPAGSILIHLKGDPALQQLLLKRLRRLMTRLAPEIRLDELLYDRPISHLNLLQRLGEYRYLLSLSVAEGFGLGQRPGPQAHALYPPSQQKRRPHQVGLSRLLSPNHPTFDSRTASAVTAYKRRQRLDAASAS